MLRVAVPYGTLSSKSPAHTIARDYDRGYGHLIYAKYEFNWPSGGIRTQSRGLADVDMHAIQTM